MHYGSLTREEDDRLVQILGGEEVVRAMIAKSELPPVEPPKYGRLTRGHTESVVNYLGGLDVAFDVAAGRKKVTVEDVIRILFDQSHGRGIPFPGMKGVVDANWAFYLAKPAINYAMTLACLQEFYGSGFVFMAVSEFQERCHAVIERVKNDPLIANLLNGPYFPFVIPQLAGDLGQLLDDTIVPALERSYRAQFPGRPFTNYRHGELARQVMVIAETRQERLVEAMAKGSVCGVYFPALQGFGISADREFIGRLPKCLILSGMEVPVVVTAYPEIFGRDHNTPGMDMASLQWQSSVCSLYFRAGGDEASFGYGDLYANGNYAGGVSVLG